MPDPDMNSLGLSPVQQAFIRQLVAKMVRSAVGQMLEESQRLGLQWRLRPGTVSSRPGSDAARVPVAIDGADATAEVPVMSLIGMPPPSARVMVAEVPPAGNYLLGFAGGGGQPTVRQTYTTAGAHTWRRPNFGRWLWVRTQAGGGAGGGAAATGAGESSMGSGGGGGACSELWIPMNEVPAEVTVTVGAGGTAVSGGNGNAGGTSSWGSLCSAAGGSGGIVRAAGSVPNGTQGGAGGSTGVGLVLRGTAGGMGWGDGQLGISGPGGNSPMGGGAQGLRNGTSGSRQVGVAGGVYGGGGGGALNSGSVSAAAGGVGAVGIVAVSVIF